MQIRKELTLLSPPQGAKEVIIFNHFLRCKDLVSGTLQVTEIQYNRVHKKTNNESEQPDWNGIKSLQNVLKKSV